MLPLTQYKYYQPIIRHLLKNLYPVGTPLQRLIALSQMPSGAKLKCHIACQSLSSIPQCSLQKKKGDPHEATGWWDAYCHIPAGTIIPWSKCPRGQSCTVFFSLVLDRPVQNFYITESPCIEIIS
jgi:hypothetical protein